MASQKVQDAMKMFVDTIDLPFMEVEDPQFAKLYLMECDLLAIINKFNEEELKEYKHLVELYEAANADKMWKLRMHKIDIDAESDDDY